MDLKLIKERQSLGITGQARIYVHSSMAELDLEKCVETCYVLGPCAEERARRNCCRNSVATASALHPCCTRRAASAIHPRPEERAFRSSVTQLCAAPRLKERAFRSSVALRPVGYVQELTHTHGRKEKFLARSRRWTVFFSGDECRGNVIVCILASINWMTRQSFGKEYMAF